MRLEENAASASLPFLSMSVVSAICKDFEKARKALCQR
jgi:hypothetical protein